MNIGMRKSLTYLGLGLGLSLTAFDAGATQDTILINGDPFWTGAYFGSSFGAGSSNNISHSIHETDSSKDVFVTFPPLTTQIESSTSTSNANLSGKATGSVADLFIGYNYNPKCTNVLFGGQLEGSFFSDISWKTTGKLNESSTSVSTITEGVPPVTFVTNEPSSNTTTTEVTQKLSSLFSLILRGGILVKPTWLVYVLGGGTEGNFVLSNDFNDAQKRNKWAFGYTIGGGVEHKFNENWSVRAEYRYLHTTLSRSYTANSTESSSQSSPGSVFTETSNFQSTTTVNSHTTFNYNMLMLGIVYQF